MSRDDALALVDAWVAQGWLRALDRALARFIAEHDTGAGGITLIAAALTSHQLGHSQTCLDLDALAADANATLALADEEKSSGRLRDVDVAAWMTALRADAGSVGRGPGTTPLVLAGHRLYLRRYWDYERVVARALRARLAAGTLTVVTGGPGTGKTTSVMTRLEALQSEADRPLRVALAAPTGKAAARLGEQATTLHRLLGRRPGSRHFRHHAGHPLPHDVVVVDEASMVDLEMTAQLLQALRPGAKLILLGDKDQLASVEAGAVFADLCELGGTHVVRLEHSWRFGAHPGIGALAAAVNSGDARAVQAAWDAGHADIALRSPEDFERCVIEDGYRPFLETARDHTDPAVVLAAFAEFQVLCALREGDYGVSGLNMRIEAALRHRGLIRDTDDWYHGRPVMVTRNDYSLGLMNGDVGITLRDGDQAWVWFQPGGQLKRVLPSRLAEVETVFAMTVHKSQGSEFGHTVLVLPDRSNPVLTRELLYTGITRSRERFTLLAPEKAVLEQALARRTLRASGLAAALEDER